MPHRSASRDLYALVYRSRPTERLSARALTSLLMTARRWNAEHGLTGRLVVVEPGDGSTGWFTQYLEGPELAVRTCLDRIGQDRRHRDLEVVASRSIARRRYPDWHMDIEATAGGGEAAVERLAAALVRVDGTPARPALRLRSGGARLTDERTR